MRDEEKQATSRKLPAIVAGAVSTAALATFGVHAQEQGGALATFGLFFGGEYRANDPDEDESSLTTGLRFNLSSVTESQSFNLSADGRFILDESRDEFEFERPGLTLDYAWNNRSTAFDVGLSYRTQDVEGTEEVVDPITGTVVDLIDDDGTLESLRLTAGLETGREARFGTETRITFTDRTYSGTSDPDLTDLESWQFGTALRFEVDPRITLRTSANYRETQEDDAAQTENRTTRFGIGGEFLIDPLWSASANLQYSLFETEELFSGSRVLSEEDGVGFSLGLNRQFRDGNLGVSFARETSDIGAEDSLRIVRNRNLHDGGELSWSLGVVSFPNGDVSPVVSASYSRPTPSGSLSASLRQTTAVNSDDESVVSTAIALNYGHDINAVSGWSLNGSLTNVDIVGSDTGDQTRALVGVTYNHALTRDWNFSTSLRYRVTYADSDQDNSASILSLSLQRSFSFRP